MARFAPVDPKQSFPELEERILERWRERDVFHRSFTNREGAPLWSFYEGPPTANGRPGSHHVLARVFKDIYPRFKTMTGHQVPRKAGWDCHGLPVELEVERELGITSKEEIEEFGIAEFNARCRESVFRYVEDWNRLTERIGFWLDLDDPYVTMTNEYIESVWWALRRMWDDGRLYEDYKVVPVLPARRHRPLLARGRPGLPGRRGPGRLREAPCPGSGGAPGARRSAAGLDDDALDADHQRGGRRWAGDRVRPSSGRRSRSSCWRGTVSRTSWARTPRCSTHSPAISSPARPTSLPSTTSPTTARGVTPS